MDLDLGWFHINESSLYLTAKGIGYHRPNTRFPEEFEIPTGLDESWSGFVAQEIGGFWWKKPAAPEEEDHSYGIMFRDLLIGNDVFSVRGSFEHGGGPDDPFNSTVPVPKEEIPKSRWSLRKIEVWVAEGAGEILQFGGQITVAAILGFFKNQPVKFDVSVGRILKDIEVEGPNGPITLTLPVVQLIGSLAPVQNHTQPTPDGRLRMPMFEKFAFQINRIRFELIFSGGTVQDFDIPSRIQLQVDLGLELGDDPQVEGENPKFEAEVPGLGFVYPSPTSHFGDFKILWEGIWFETKVKLLPLHVKGYEFSISRVGLGFGAGETDAYWLSFDANLQFPDSLGQAEVYGLRLGWDNNGMLYSIEGIGIEIKKPGFEGVGILKFLDGPPHFVPVGEEPITIQSGSISGLIRLAFPAAGDPFTFEVGLTHGKYKVDTTGDLHTFWMAMAELVFTQGLPLGLADLAFYGLAIALGNNVKPHKADATSWYDWYSKELPKYSIIASNKWTAAHDRIVFGLGLVWGSSIRSGYPHNERLMGVYNSSEGQCSSWLFEAKIRFLKEVTKPGDPQIAILLAFAPDQVLFRAEFHFSFPAEEGGGAAAGLIMTARTIIEVLSDRTGAGRHHIYLGRNQPYSERINASVLLGFFTSRAFYMLDWAELALSNITLPPLAMAFGFAQGWSVNKKYGPLRLYFEVNIELEVGFTFISAVYGFLRFYGGISLRLWGFGFGLSLDAAFTFFASDGWKLTGTIKVKLNLPWPIPDYKKSIPIDWGPGVSPPSSLTSPIRQLALTSPSFDGSAAVHEWSETNVLGVPSDFNAERSELAVDGAIVLAFRAPVGKRVPWISGVDVQPVDGSGEWKFRYTVEDIILRHLRPGTTSFELLPDSFKNGFLEINSNAPATSSAPTTEGAPLSQAISIWGETPGEQLRNLGGLERSGAITWIDGFLDLFGTWPCGPDVVMDSSCVHFDLDSFRLLDSSYTRVTLLPGGAPIRSHSILNPDAFPIGSGPFVVLDEVVPNPRPDLWNKHEKVLSLPYIYRVSDRQSVGFIPFSSALDIDLPPTTFVEVTLLGVFPEESFTVQGLNNTEVIVSATASGSGLHELILDQPDINSPITIVRITSVSNLIGLDINDSRISVLALLCYRTLDQSKLQQYILEQRESLNQLIEILQLPPGLPGQNADHFHLHPQGTVYEVTPVVTCERKGPESNWEVVHDHLSLVPATVTVGPPPVDLTPYLTETIPAREQDPVYLDDDMQIRFNRSYGPEMYTVSGFDFRVEILDVQRQPVPLQEEWTFSEEPALNPLQELLLETLLSSPCVTADITAVRKKLALTLRPVLSPRTYYYMVIRSSAHPGHSLFEIPFSTSRYHSFDEQYLELGTNTIHELLPIRIDDARLESLINGLSASTREEEHVLFERIWEDVLGLGFREHPERGELVVFYQPTDTGLGSPRVIMIDSPEPLLVDRRTEFHFNGPSSSEGGGTTSLTVRNFDGTRALLFVRDENAVVDLPTGDYDLTTMYRREIEGLPTQRIDGDSSPSMVGITLTVTGEAQILVEDL